MLDRIAPGDHVCWIADDAAGRVGAIAAFLRAGLSARHRVVYSGDDPAPVLAALASDGVDVREAQRAGRLRVAVPDQSYLAGGRFDAVATAGLWRAEQARARAEGYLGMRVVGDMAWASRPVPGVERLGWYEAQINTIFADGFVAGVCAYDRRLFDPLRLRRLAWTHPASIGDGSPFDPASALRIRRVPEPYGLRLSGEADRSNRSALAVVLEQLVAEAADRRPITIDVRDLRFADTAATRLLVEAAGGRTVRLVGCSPTVRRLLDFHGAAGIPGLIVDRCA